MWGAADTVKEEHIFVLKSRLQSRIHDCQKLIADTHRDQKEKTAFYCVLLTLPNLVFNCKWQSVGSLVVTKERLIYNT